MLFRSVSQSRYSALNKYTSLSYVNSDYSILDFADEQDALNAAKALEECKISFDYQEGKFGLLTALVIGDEDLCREGFEF